MAKILFVMWIITVLIMFAICSFRKFKNIKMLTQEDFEKGQTFFQIMFGTGVILFGLFLIGLV